MINHNDNQNQQLDIPPNTTNMVGATNSHETQAPNNPPIHREIHDPFKKDWSVELIESEKQRRALFKQMVYFAAGMVGALYLALIVWVFLNVGTDNHHVWHIATILALPATTILFFLIKVLTKSSNDSKEDKQTSTPAGEVLEKSGELADKFLDIFKTLLNKK